MANLHVHDIINMKSDYGKKLSEAIELEYGFKILTYSPIPEISFTSRKALLTTDLGIFFLKEKPFYSKGEAELFRSSTFQNYCAKKSKRFVKIIQTKSDDCFLKFEDSIYFITPYQEGSGFSGKENELIRMLDTLVELKELGSGYLEEFADRKEFLPQNKSYEIILPFSLLEPMIQTDEDKEIFSDLKSSLKILKDEFDSFEDIEYSMSHSDCIIFNFQLMGNTAILHDFDNAKVLPSIHDIAEFFVSSCLLNYRGSITNLKLPIFLTCHTNTSDTISREILKHITDEEKKLLPICIEIVWLWSLMLSVIKEDYKIIDLVHAIKNISDRKLHHELVEIFNS